MPRPLDAHVPILAAIALVLAAPVAAQEIDWEARMAKENALRDVVVAALRKGDAGPALAALKAGHPGYFEIYESYDPTLSMLTVAIRADQPAAVEALLAAGVGFDLGGEINRDYDWIAAVEAGDPRIVRSLLAHGADPNQRLSWRANGEPSGGSSTPLTRAAEAGDAEIARLLLDAGADPNGVAVELSMDPGYSEFYSFSFRTALDCASGAVERLIAAKGGVTADKVPGLGRAAVVTDSGLRLRSGPSTDGGIIARLEAGTKVRALETGPSEEIDGKESYWIRVVLADGRVGWVFGAFLSW